MNKLYAELGLTIIILTAVITTPSPYFSLTIGAFCLCGQFACRNRIHWWVFIPALSVAAASFAASALTVGNDPALWLFGHLPLYREGLWHGFTTFARITGGVITLIFFSGLLGLEGMTRLALGLPIPKELLELYLTTYRFITLLQEELRRVRRAQRLRLGYANWQKSLASAASLAGIILLRAYDRGLIQEKARRLKGGLSPAAVSGVYAYEYRIGQAMVWQATGLLVASTTLLL